LCVLNQYGNGRALFIPISLGKLIAEFRLEEHYLLMANAVNLLLGEANFLRITPYQGLQVTTFTKGKNILVNLVNGSGSRPLQQNIPLHDLELELKTDNGSTVKNVRQLISGGDLKFQNHKNTVKIVIPRLDIWECLLIETS
jgi:hypothetical protein